MGKNQHRWRANCQCGQTAAELIGAPILSAVCYCENCRVAGHAFERAEGAPRTVGADGGVEYCLYRKDRVAVVRGGEYLQEHRLTPDSKVRRVVATCCNSPMFLDFTQGHWLSVYRSRLPAGVQPPQMRIVTGGRHFAERHSQLFRLFAGIHDPIVVVVGRDGIPTNESRLVIPDQNYE